MNLNKIELPDGTTALNMTLPDIVAKAQGTKLELDAPNKYCVINFGGSEEALRFGHRAHDLFGSVAYGTIMSCAARLGYSTDFANDLFMYMKHTYLHDISRASSDGACVFDGTVVWFVYTLYDLTRPPLLRGGTVDDALQRFDWLDKIDALDTLISDDNAVILASMRQLCPQADILTDDALLAIIAAYEQFNIEWSKIK